MRETPRKFGNVNFGGFLNRFHQIIGSQLWTVICKDRQRLTAIQSIV